MKTTRPHGVRGWVKSGGKSGAILGLVLIIVLALSIVGLGIMHLSSVNAVEVSRSYNLSKAFWAAEAGLYHTRARILMDSGYRNQVVAFPQQFVSSTPGLNFTGAVSYVSSSNCFSIISTGTVQGAIRVVAQSVRMTQDEGWPDAFNYALFGGTNDFYLKKDSSFNGPVFVNGDISYKTSLVITNGTMYETTNGVVSVVAGSGTPPNPPPTTPVLKTADFNNLIANVPSLGLPVLTNVVSLLGGTNYVKGDVAFPPAGVIGTTGGADTLVVGGSLTINSGAAFTNQFHIIAGGDVTIGKNLGSTATMFIYSSGNVNLSKDVTVVSNTMIFANGNITSEKAITYTGVLFANGAIDFRTDSTITGSVVAAQGFAAGNLKTEKGFNITWSTNAFSFLDILTNEFQVPVSIQVNRDWQELFPE